MKSISDIPATSAFAWMGKSSIFANDPAFKARKTNSLSGSLTMSLSVAKQRKVGKASGTFVGISQKNDERIRISNIK